MHGTFASWLMGALEVGFFAAVAFVVLTYLFALTLTRGAFGWPGVRYFVTETLWVGVTQALLPFGWFFGAELPIPRRGGGPSLSGAPVLRPIILVHGYTQNRMNFVWLARTLRRQGLGPFFGFNYHSFRPIEESAVALARFVEGVVRKTGASEVDLVCHSLGGLVARTYVDLLDGETYVRRVVTLGTPHRGVDYAYPVLGASVRDLHSRSAFIERLHRGVRGPKVRFHSVYSIHDNIVFPGAASSLGDRGTDVIVHRHGHFGILFSVEVAEHVRRALAAEDQILPLSTAGTPTASMPSGTSDTTTALAPMTT